MKSFILLSAMAVLFSSFLIFQLEINTYQYYLFKFNALAEEVAASGAQYIKLNDYMEGNIIFNTVEGEKAAIEILKSSCNINNSFMPVTNRFVNHKLEYKLYFIDNSNTSFPYNFSCQLNNHSFNMNIKEPSVVAIIDLGEFDFKLDFIEKKPSVIGIAAFEWKEY